MNFSIPVHFLLIACELIQIFSIAEVGGGGVRTAVSMVTILDTAVQITHKYNQASHICTLLINS
jgi:hypothetical protein